MHVQNQHGKHQMDKWIVFKINDKDITSVIKIDMMPLVSKFDKFYLLRCVTVAFE